MAARMAHADFIQTLPDGYRSHLGAQGVRLSGGQRQRMHWPERFSVTRNSCYLMRPPARSTQRASGTCSRRSPRSCESGRPSSSPTGKVINADRIVVMDEGRLSIVHA